LNTGELITTPPKARTGPRTVALPHAVIPDQRRHLDNSTSAEPDALIFTGKHGGVLRRANFRRATKWGATVTKLGVPNLHFHDLRHTGTRSRPSPARRSATSWSGWATTACEPR
jgi:integrase